MAEARRRSAATPILAFFLGALVAALAAAGYIFFIRGAEPETVDVPPVEIEAPKLPDINMPDAPKLPRG